VAPYQAGLGADNGHARCLFQSRSTRKRETAKQGGRENSYNNSQPPVKARCQELIHILPGRLTVDQVDMLSSREVLRCLCCGQRLVVDRYLVERAFAEE
jgi:hypothetical protein